MTNEFLIQTRIHWIKKMAEMEDPAFKKNIKGIVAKMFKIQWHTVVQEIALHNLQQNQVEQPKPGLEICESAKQVRQKQQVEQSSSITRRELMYKKLRKMEPTEFDNSMNSDKVDEWIHSIQNILEFIELEDKDKVWCASCLLKRDTRYL